MNSRKFVVITSIILAIIMLTTVFTSGSLNASTIQNVNALMTNKTQGVCPLIGKPCPMAWMMNNIGMMGMMHQGMMNKTQGVCPLTGKPCPMTGMMQRGNIAMSFNQSKISHNFVATSKGGKIIITALNNGDIQTINQIKNHIKDIQKEFSEGNFTKPFFIHAQKVPGTQIMTSKKSLIKYDVQKLKNGSSLILTSNDKQVVDAIQRFIEFQATAHHGY
ncbi:MAG TPA: hypothetical protein VN704_12965 [Verrucomicrobiae bacterium]|nr:hypothetical protein [Verrucomicrobiae bacterium]